MTDNIKLFKGDCLEIMDTLIQNNTKVDMILVDPPYAKTHCKWDIIIPPYEMWIRINQLVKENGCVAIFGSEPFSSMIRTSNLQQYKYDWIWEKTQATGHFNAKKQPMRAYENIMIFYKKQPLYNPQKTNGHKPINTYTKYLATVNKTEVYGKSTKELSGGGETDRYPRNVITFKSDKQTQYLHPSQKPVALLEYLIKTYTNKEDIVLDFCMGSGSTGVACVNTNRKFIGIELDEKYFDISLNRIASIKERGV